MAIQGQLDEADFAGKIERLIAEDRQLKSHLSNQKCSLADLQTRVHRLEISVIFRFLRWLGPRLAWTGIPLFRGAAEPGQKSASPGTTPQEYAESAQELVLFRRALSQLRVRSARSSGASRVSVLVEARELSQPGFERLIRSITQQDHWEWELFVSTEGEPPAWLANSLAMHVVGHRAEILSEGDLRRSLQLALDRCTGEFVVVLDSATVLEPDALHQLVLAAARDVIAVYSDWDHVDAAGRFHSPCFTPELSLDLLRRAAYWGQCYLARTASVRRLNWPGDAAAPANLHDLALRLAETSQPIRRVPQVLWHDQSHALERTGPVLASSPPPGPGLSRVSVIVCSRDPDQLTRCLEVVLPTLGRRHELIVVAHGHAGKGHVLEQIAASHQVQCVRYEGPFHFGLMNHLGVAQSSGQVLCFLNDDVEPLTPDWLERMLAQAERPGVGVVGALLLFPDRTIQHAGVLVGGGFLPTHIGRSLTESFYWPWLRSTREVTAVTGACAALRREVWQELGGFDLRFPVNYNDIDLCLRATQRGYRNLIEADAVLIHDECKTRDPVVLPEEIELFTELWGDLVSVPDRFFNPQLDLGEKAIRLRKTHPAARLAGINVGAPPPPTNAGAARKLGEDQ
jgi:O-antigen biosynthesis protein